MPRRLRRELPGFYIRTVQEEGWAGLQNGHLLEQASAMFDILLTNDQRLRYQQNLSMFRIAVVVIAAGRSRYRDLLPLLPRIRAAIGGSQEGCVAIVERG
jgi:hypothetical protein